MISMKQCCSLGTMTIALGMYALFCTSASIIAVTIGLGDTAFPDPSDKKGHCNQARRFLLMAGWHLPGQQLYPCQGGKRPLTDTLPITRLRTCWGGIERSQENVAKQPVSDAGLEGSHTRKAEARQLACRRPASCPLCTACCKPATSRSRMAVRDALLSCSSTHSIVSMQLWIYDRRRCLSAREQPAELSSDHL